MRGAHLVVGAVVAALEERPERLDAVRVGLLADVLAHAVPDRPVPRESPVRPVVVGEHLGPSWVTRLRTNRWSVGPSVAGTTATRTRPVARALTGRNSQGQSVYLGI